MSRFCIIFWPLHKIRCPNKRRTTNMNRICTGGGWRDLGAKTCMCMWGGWRELKASDNLRGCSTLTMAMSCKSCIRAWPRSIFLFSLKPNVGLIIICTYTFNLIQSLQGNQNVIVFWTTYRESLQHL